jgi:hypothetical protein
MFVEQRFDLFFRREPSRASVLQPAPDAGKLFGSCMIFSGAEFGIDLKRKIGEFGLRGFGPSFDSR